MIDVFGIVEILEISIYENGKSCYFCRVLPNSSQPGRFSIVWIFSEGFHGCSGERFWVVLRARRFDASVFPDAFFREFKNVDGCKTPAHCVGIPSSGRLGSLARLFLLYVDK